MSRRDKWYDQPITLSIPDAGMLAVVANTYEILTNDWFQQWMYNLLNENRASPDYLLMSHETRNDFIRLKKSAWSYFLRAIPFDDIATFFECYPNMITGKQLPMVVFPDIAPKTVLATSHLTVARESIAHHARYIIEKRTYERYIQHPIVAITQDTQQQQEQAGMGNE
jgi:hypothetical protein